MSKGAVSQRAGRSSFGVGRRQIDRRGAYSAKDITSGHLRHEKDIVFIRQHLHRHRHHRS